MINEQIRWEDTSKRSRQAKKKEKKGGMVLSKILKILIQGVGEGAAANLLLTLISLFVICLIQFLRWSH